MFARVPRLKAASNEMLHLDLMRFVASVAIVAHHSREYLIPVADRARRMSTRTGGLALFVDLFFVISGFVIAYVYSNRLKSLQDCIGFMQRRIGRLVPLHWLTLAISILIWVAISRHVSHVNHAQDFSPVCVADTALLTHSVISCGNGNYFNGQSWSISAEMFMYLLFPVMLIVSNLRRWLPLLISASILIAIGAYHTYLGSFPFFSWEMPSGVLRALPSFLFGITLFNYRHKTKAIRLARPLLLLTTVLMILAMLFDAPTFLTLLMVYLSALFTVASDVQGTISPFVKRTAPLGQLTYSIYLWHGMFILVIMNAIGDKICMGQRF